MTSISLYKPGKKSKLDVAIDIPSSWNELTGEELKFICQKFIEEDLGYQIKVEIFLYIITFRAGLQNKKLFKDWQQQLSAEDVAVNGLDTINYLFDTADLTAQLFPEFTIGTDIIYGPQSNFDNITCGEFEDTEVFFNQYNTTKVVKAMAMLTAILWRTSETKRLPYFDYDTEKFVPAVQMLPPEILLANYLWYAGCRAQLPKLFPETFSKSGGEADLSAFTKCIHAGAGPKNGTRDQIRKTLLKEFFLDMELEAQNLKNETK